MAVALAASSLGATFKDVAHDGVALAQRFLGGDGSVIVSSAGAACAAGGIIDVDASTYIDPDDRIVPFGEITRSRAASVQFLAASPGMTVSVRVQLKFAVDGGPALLLLPESGPVDIRSAREPSGDSFLIGDPDLVEGLRRASEQGLAARLVTVSLGPSRVVIDTLPEIGFQVFDACRRALPSTPSTALPQPMAVIRVMYHAEPTSETRATPEEALVCGVTDHKARLHRGRVLALNGFTAPTDLLYAEFDEAGAPIRIHIPGLLEAGAMDGGEWRSRLSASAAGNDPLAPNAVTGCLGLKPVALCSAPEPFSMGDLALALSEDGGPSRRSGLFPSGEPENIRELGICFGDMLFASSLGEEAPDFDVVEIGEATARAASRNGSPASPLVFAGGSGSGFGQGGGGFFGDSGGGGGGRREGGPPPGDELRPPDPPAVIGLPAGVWLAGSAFAAAAAIFARRRPRRVCAADTTVGR